MIESLLNFYLLRLFFELISGCDIVNSENVSERIEELDSEDDDNDIDDEEGIEIYCTEELNQVLKIQVMLIFFVA